MDTQIQQMDTAFKKLDIVIISNQNTTNRLVDVIAQLKIQVDKTNSLLELNRLEAGMINEQLQLGLTEQQRSNYAYFSKVKYDSVIFSQAALKLTDIENDPNNLLKYDSIKQSILVDSVYVMLKSQLSNPFLLTNDTLWKQWMKVVVNFSSWRQEYIKQPSAYVNLNTQKVVYPGEKEFQNEQRKGFIYLMNLLYRLYNNCFFMLIHFPGNPKPKPFLLKDTISAGG